MSDPANQVPKRKKSVTEMIERWEEIPVKLDRVRKEPFLDMKCSNNFECLNDSLCLQI